MVRFGIGEALGWLHTVVTIEATGHRGINAREIDSAIFSHHLSWAAQQLNTTNEEVRIVDSERGVLFQCQP
jgi:hypothetical protein